jgi:hypothetical protein
MSPVSVSYDSVTRRFALFYQRFDPAALSTGERIWARTSDDGLSWSAAVDLGVRTVHPPSANQDLFGEDKGILYAHRSIDPYLYTRSWSISGSTVSLGTAWTRIEDRLVLPPHLGSNLNSFVILWADETSSTGVVEIDWTAPFAQWDDLITVGAGNVPSLMGQAGSVHSYLLRTE